jgi:hypothetical protein
LARLSGGRLGWAIAALYDERMMEQRDQALERAEALALPFPLRVLRNAENRSFSEANGQGVEAATGSLICFLNNDVDPITEGWLGYLVETLTTQAKDRPGQPVFAIGKPPAPVPWCRAG